MTEETMIVEAIAMGEIWNDPEFNCRGAIQHIDVVDLVKDIEANGLIQPGAVAPLTEEQLKVAPPGKKWRLIAGYRRFACMQILKKTHYNCVIREDMQDEYKARCFNLSENQHRKNLDLIQETRAVAKLKEADPRTTEKIIAAHLGVSRGWVQIRTMMADLPDDIQQEIVAFKLTNKQIRNLYSIYGVSGLDEVTRKTMTVDALKIMKDGKIKGRSVNVNANLIDKTKKRMRTRSDMLQMLDHLAECGLKPGPHTRMLAWAAGNISDIDLHRALTRWAEHNGHTYFLPDGIYRHELGIE